MHMRWLQPNPSTDLHWGFLDKFAVNEYLPRAFMLAALATLSAAVALHGLCGLDGPPQVRLRIEDPVNFGPRPEIQSPGVRIPHPAPKVPSVVRRIVPVPRLRPVDDSTDPTAHGAGISPAAAGPFPLPGTSDGAGPAIGVVEPTWPSPDDYVPVEHEPVLVTMQAPVYPELARDAGIDGTVLVRVLVGEDGFVHQALVLQSVMGLDDAALVAARTAVFRAALQQERPVAVWIVIPIEFQLH